MANIQFSKNLVQFMIALIISWLIMYCVPPKLFFEGFIPFSLFLLFWLISISVVAGGWPLAPPEGFWKSGDKKVATGLLMTLFVIILGIVTTLIATKVWPAVPLFPVAFFLGAFLFVTTLWYAFIWGSYPLEQKSGFYRLIVAVIVITAIALILWYTCANLNGTPFANAPFSPHGIFPAEYMVGQMFWFLVWVMLFGPTMQGYPFNKLGAPWDRVVQTVFIIILGRICWTVTIRFLDPGFSFAAIGGALVAWSLFQSAIFEYYPNADYDQPQRCLYNLITVIVLAAIWVPLLRLIMTPILHKASLAGVTFDISAIGLFYALHVVAILLVIHNSFWFKIPFIPADPPDVDLTEPIPLDNGTQP